MKKLAAILLAVALFLCALPAEKPAAARPLLQGSDVIAQVNALRAANGLAPYKINNALMSAAQAHSEFQASIGYMTHTGADGSRPASRAIAAGYGDGAQVFVSENIASGSYMSPSHAVEIWQGDTLHLNTMLSPNFTDAGAGVASDGQITYITLDVGYVDNRTGSTNSSTAQAPVATAGPGSAAPATVTATSKGFVLSQVMTVTPQPDGAILHIVQPGEVLLNIAVAYNVKLSDLYQLNYLTDQSVIYPGQKLKIKGPDPTATPTETATPTRAPTATRRPTRSPTPTATITPTGQAGSQTPTPTSANASTGPDLLLIAVGALMVIGLGLVTAGSLLKRK